MNIWLMMIIFFVLTFGVIALAMFLEHVQKMATLRAQGKSSEYEHLKHQLAALTQQVAELRQMHTDYALGIDSHLQHLDYRLSSLENRIEQLEQQQVPR